MNLANQSVSAIGLGLAGTSVLTTAAVTVGSAPAVAIAAGKADTFTVNTSSGSHTITLNGQTGDTVEGQVNQLNDQLNVLGITASLNSSGNLQFQSSNAFSVAATTTSTGADLIDHAGDKVVNTGLNTTNLRLRPRVTCCPLPWDPRQPTSH